VLVLLANGNARLFVDVRTSNAFLRLLCVTMGYARADPFRFYIDRDGVTESRNGVTCPPKPPPNIAIYGDTARQIVVAEVVDREVCWKVVVCVSTRAAVEMSKSRTEHEIPIFPQADPSFSVMRRT
jgi:hypothetical protein